MGEGKPDQHPADTNLSVQGGPKDTNDLSGIKGIQDEGMKEKGKQVDQLPEAKINPAVTSEPNKR